MLSELVLTVGLLVLADIGAPTATSSSATKALVECDYKLPNNVPPMSEGEERTPPQTLPIPDVPFIEHVRGTMTDDETARLAAVFSKPIETGTFGLPDGIDAAAVTAFAAHDGKAWLGTAKGLYRHDGATWSRHEDYGLNGPLSTSVTGLAFDRKGALWVGGPQGLSVLEPDDTWRYVRGKQGLPVEDVTCLAIDGADNLWVGTSHGAALHKPYAEGRQWFYRAGKRYLPGNVVSAIHIAEAGFPVYFQTDAGIGRIDGVEMTLKKRADVIEARLNERHRRMGLVAACTLDNAENPTSHVIIDDDNDGLWTSYHVVAASLAYAVTGDDRWKKSAAEGMHAMVMLQNASGTPGLVARSVLPPDEGAKKVEEAKNERDPNKRYQWRPTPDGKLYWKSDTSSDEIDGHFFALFAYYEHIARHDPAESALIQKQARDIMGYIVDNGYYLIDWDGEPTTWGKWAPEVLNDDPRRYGENGLGALEILSFLKTTYHITGEERFKKEFDKLICEHGYLGNVLLEKKLFPDENNHSDDQLATVAYYPWLQMEGDPKVRLALALAARRHYWVVEKDYSSFFDFTFGTIVPKYIDFAGSVQALCDVPTDRRMWGMINSHRADVIINPRRNRHNELILTHVLPPDERNWTKWNIDPYVPDGGGNIIQRVAGTPLSPHNVRGFGGSREGDGRNEDDGASWLLAYWMGRYHGFIGE